LAQCLAGYPPRELPRALLTNPCGQALFGVIVEGLADRFEPSLCDVYARMFANAVSQVVEGVDPISLVVRYERVRHPRAVAGKPRRIFVLSRITLGADVAVTSVLIAAAKKRFPHSEVVFVAPRKNYELFAGDPHIHHLPVNYSRGGLRERLGVWNELKALLADEHAILVDPDSRLTQLGLLPVSADDHYHLFESRAYGRETNRALPDLAAAWAAETFGVAGSRPYVCLGTLPARTPYIAVSLGVGENLAKRLPDPFEEELFKTLGETGLPLCVDLGTGGEEAQRVTRAIERSGVRASTWNGAFSGFATIIAGSRLYIGYDSAGQHVAAACGVPLISIFAGFPAERMFYRWRPCGERSTVLRVDTPDPAPVLERVREALPRILGRTSEVEGTVA
jgi:ADP-heptose:LPS heptosyltransferase